MDKRIFFLVVFIFLAGIVFSEDMQDPYAEDTNIYTEGSLNKFDDATSGTWDYRNTFNTVGAGVVEAGKVFVPSIISGGSCGGSAPTQRVASAIPISDKVNSFLSSSISILVGVVLVAALLAAFIYAVGQAFGAETRARAITLASTLLVSSTIVLVLFFIAYNITPVLFSSLSATPDDFFSSLGIIAPAATIALGVFAIAGVLYVIGGFLQIPSITAAAKEELFASVVTLIRVLFIGLSLAGLGALFYSLTSEPGAGGDPIYSAARTSSGGVDLLDVSINISLNMLKEIVRNYGFMLIYNTILHSMYTSTLFFGLSWRAMYSFSLGPIFRPFVDVLGQMMQFMQIAIAEWVIHAATLCAIKRWSWELFIPFAVILRAIPQTRGGGDALLALIFAFLIVYPLMFVVDYEIHKLMRGLLVDPSDAVGAFIGGGVGGMLATVGIMMFLTASVFMPLFAGAAMNLLVELSKNAIYYIILMSFLLPFLNIFITLTFAREQAKFFNVDVNFMAFTRLI